MARPRHVHDRLWFPAGAAKGGGVDGTASTRDPRVVTRRCSRMRTLGGCRRRRHRRGRPRRRHGPPSSRRRRRARGGLNCRRSLRRSGRRGRRRRRIWRASGRTRLRWRSSLRRAEAERAGLFSEPSQKLPIGAAAAGRGGGGGVCRGRGKVAAYLDTSLSSHFARVYRRGLQPRSPPRESRRGPWRTCVALSMTQRPR